MRAASCSAGRPSGHPASAPPPQGFVAASGNAVLSPPAAAKPFAGAGPPPAWHLAREPVVLIIGLAGQAPSRFRPLSSNVRPHRHLRAFPGRSSTCSTLLSASLTRALRATSQLASSGLHQQGCFAFGHRGCSVSPDGSLFATGKRPTSPACIVGAESAQEGSSSFAALAVHGVAVVRTLR